MKFLKRNQIIIYVIVLMLMTAGYLNYTTVQDKESLQTTSQIAAKDDTKIADIGDATLVSSNDLVSENSVNESTNSTQNSVDTNSSNSMIANTSTNTNTSDNSSNTVTNTTSKETSSNSVSKDDYFSKSKLERDSMYSQNIETYEKILNSSNALETQRQSATQEITKINEIKNSIMICENLIKTKGFENSVVFVNGDSISVIVGAQELKQEEVAQIQNIISREMSAKIENIHISTK